MDQNFNDILERYKSLELPACPNCKSEDTAEVNVGITGITMQLAASTSKFHLRANGKPGKYFCNSCKEYFD